MATGHAAPAGLSPELSATRLRLERTWAEGAASAELTASEYQWWSMMRSAHRFLLQIGQKVLVWKVFMQAATVQETWTVVDLDLDPVTGLAMLLQRDGDRKEVWVSHTPVLLAPGVFIWLPYYIDYQFIPKAEGESRHIRFSALVRMQFNPNTREEQVNYIGDRHSFEDSVSLLDGGA